MIDEEIFIDAFEAGQVAPDAFHHADHVRLAFSYLCKYSALEALSKFCVALKRFAAAQGKAERYNETITFAYFFLINERIAQGKFINWEHFARNNPDLLAWNNGILNRYYRESTLKSELAVLCSYFLIVIERECRNHTRSIATDCSTTSLFGRSLRPRGALAILSTSS